jgi:hypothetical protein
MEVMEVTRAVVWRKMNVLIVLLSKLLLKAVIQRTGLAFVFDQGRQSDKRFI